ncbi:unnamed protein product, partial [Iphiclides podalirius]
MYKLAVPVLWQRVKQNDGRHEYLTADNYRGAQIIGPGGRIARDSLFRESGNRRNSPAFACCNPAESRRPWLVPSRAGVGRDSKRPFNTEHLP